MVIQVELLNLSIKDYRRPVERCHIIESLYTRPHGGSFHFYQDCGTEVGHLMSVPGDRAISWFGGVVTFTAQDGECR
jgi:hypothetical protein